MATNKCWRTKGLCWFHTIKLYQFYYLTEIFFNISFSKDHPIFPEKKPPTTSVLCYVKTYRIPNFQSSFSLLIIYYKIKIKIERGRSVCIVPFSMKTLFIIKLTYRITILLLHRASKQFDSYSTFLLFPFYSFVVTDLYFVIRPDRIELFLV